MKAITKVALLGLIIIGGLFAKTPMIYCGTGVFDDDCADTPEGLRYWINNMEYVYAYQGYTEVPAVNKLVPWATGDNTYTAWSYSRVHRVRRNYYKVYIKSIAIIFRHYRIYDVFFVNSTLYFRTKHGRFLEGDMLSAKAWRATASEICGYGIYIADWNYRDKLRRKYHCH
jgi:hypothetical protein